MENKSALTSREWQRYSRHLLIPQIGEAGQQKLKASRVLLIGAGGLGSPIALYLAAAGVGRIGIVEFDRIDRSNLQRQILFSDCQTGTAKSTAAKERLQALNPDISVEIFPSRLSSENAMEIVAPFDIVVDGSDNFPTRYLVNDACILSKKPLVYGSIFRFEGQVSLFGAQDGPCYRCLFPQPPEPGAVPSCAEGGVLGVLPGIIGTLQATETLKWLLKIGDSLSGRLLLVDALGMAFNTLKIRRNPDCPVCGDVPSIDKLIDYEVFCGLDTAGSEIPLISVAELKELLDKNADFLLLDVRSENENRVANIGGKLIPLPELPGRLTELDQSARIVVYCHSGERSGRATKLLLDNGFGDVRNLQGGIKAWGEIVGPAW